MKNHTVVCERSKGESTIRFSEIFNVAVPFIDRHLEEGRADKVVIRTTAGESVTYLDLAARVNQSGNLFRSLGLVPGDRVAMIIKDCPEFFYVFWGAIKANLIPIPINTLFRAKDYRFIFADSGCAAVVYSPEYRKEVEPALRQVNPAPAHIMLTEGEAQDFKARIKTVSPELEPAATRATDDCFMLYSSGSTASPKGAVHRHQDMVYESQYYGVETLGIREADVCFSAAKLFFAFGHGNGMEFPLWVGASTVLFDGRPTPEITFDIIERFKPSIYYGVPTLYAAQLLAMEKRKVDFSSVRICVSAGEALPADLFHRWKKSTHTEILDGIGSTEILHIFISNREGDIKPGSTGRVVPGYEARIVNEEGASVPRGESGRLLIKGGSIAVRYWNNPEKTAATMLGEWIDTGDTYYQDAEGYFHYCGRNDDMMKIGGIWCSPFEIEAKLVEHPKVLEAAVVGYFDEHKLNKPKAFVVLKEKADDTAALANELRALCQNELAPYKYPRWFEFVAELPKTPTGKVQRYKLRAFGQSGASNPASDARAS